MDLTNSKCIDTYMGTRLSSEPEEEVNSIDNEALDDDADLGSEKYNNFIIFGVIVYMVLTFILVR